jgi:hypothetical protein
MGFSKAMWIIALHFTTDTTWDPKSDLLMAQMVGLLAKGKERTFDMYRSAS